MRPVLDAMEGAKKTLCDVYSDVINGIIEAKHEELLATFEEYNKEICK